MASVPPPLPSSTRRIVLYDGKCGFCDGAVQWLLEHDRDGRLVYAALQGDTARGVRSRHPRMPHDLDSLVYVETDDRGRERVYWYSRAALGICKNLPMPWRLGMAFVLVPRFLRDLAYRAFAKVRYRIFGRLDACRVPSAEERTRFLP